MIIEEKRELEEFIMSGGGCVAVPLEIYIPENGEPRITVFSRFRRAAELFLRSASELHEQDAEAIRQANDILSAEMNAAGFYTEDVPEKLLYEYEIRDKCQLRGRGNALARLTESGTELMSLFPECEFDGELLAAVVEGDRAVSFAAVCDDCDGSSGVELYVRTADGYCGRGYASACTALLAAYYLEKNETVKYICSGENAASRRVAEKCGFTLAGTRYSFIYYAKE